ncbi:hypothetical protein IFM89_004146 [Coptis chinensis]|uniref:Uncharacterized protein n=1 Tax=Coptis chinensis TaxID=261450 RepID=A0A835H6F2_9MAGN|nr:hypothetical protein IFM89_004146 [Coptis chinensis]
MDSLEKKIIPSIALLKGIVHSETDVKRMIKRTRWILTQDPQKTLVPSIALLRTHGVPDSNISKLLLLSGCSFLRTDSFIKNVKETKKREFDPSKVVFVMAVHVLSCLSKSSWEAKCGIYKRWGWSEKEISSAFTLQPTCMGLSEKNIMSTMEFLVNKMGFDPLLISKTPVVLSYSLEKRTIPRLSVIQVLVSNGIVKEDYKIMTLVNMSEKDFLRKYVTEFEGKVPELLSVYQGKTNS